MSEPLHRARDRARAFAAAARQMADFLDRVSEVPEPGREAEYAVLLDREQSVYRERQDALHALGLRIASIETDEQTPGAD